MEGELGEYASSLTPGLVCSGVLLIPPPVLSSGRRRTGEWKGFRRVTFAASTRRRLLAAGVDMTMVWEDNHGECSCNSVWRGGGHDLIRTRWFTGWSSVGRIDEVTLNVGEHACRGIPGSKLLRPHLTVATRYHELKHSFDDESFPLDIYSLTIYAMFSSYPGDKWKDEVIVRQIVLRTWRPTEQPARSRK